MLLYKYYYILTSYVFIYDMNEYRIFYIIITDFNGKSEKKRKNFSCKNVQEKYTHFDNFQEEMCWHQKYP